MAGGLTTAFFAAAFLAGVFAGGCTGGALTGGGSGSTACKGRGDDDAHFFFLFIIVIEAVFYLVRILVRLGFKLVVSVCVKFVFVLHSYASKASVATDSDRREPLSTILACGADYSNSMQRYANERKCELSFFSCIGCYLFKDTDSVG